VTDGKVAVIFSGGNWEKIVSFQFHELDVINTTATKKKK
jgi:hypothetical protein